MTRGRPPTDADFYTDWHSDSCSDWLVDEIITYMRSTQDGLVLFEDGNGPRGNQDEDHGQRPLHLIYHDTIYWPIWEQSVSREDVKATIAWGGGFKTIVIFALRPEGLGVLDGASLMSDRFVKGWSSTICRVVAGIYDGGGYLSVTFGVEDDAARRISQ